MNNEIKKGRDKISISDIAAKAGVSTTTVSFVLNGRASEKRISNTLKEKILQIVEEIGYQPNQVARNLRTGKSQTIGLVVEDISNVFFASVAKGIEEQAYKEGYKVIYCSTENDTAKSIDLVSMLQKRQVDGYIIAPAPGLEALLKQLVDEQKPMVLFDRYLQEVDTNYVIVDNFNGAYSAVSHLISLGKKKIALVTIPSQQGQMLDREHGYKQALLNHGYTVDENLIKKISIGMGSNGKSEIKKLLSTHQVDAVFFATNYLAISGLEVVKELGLSIPDSLAIVSYDDHDVFRLHTPSISVVAQPVEDISGKVIEILLEQLTSDKATVSHHITLPTELIIRDSSRG